MTDGAGLPPSGDGGYVGHDSDGRGAPRLGDPGVGRGYVLDGKVVVQGGYNIPLDGGGYDSQLTEGAPATLGATAGGYDSQLTRGTASDYHSQLTDPATAGPGNAGDYTSQLTEAGVAASAGGGGGGYDSQLTDAAEDALTATRSAGCVKETSLNGTAADAGRAVKQPKPRGGLLRAAALPPPSVEPGCTELSQQQVVLA